jgi:hypothetical protein
MCFSGMSIEEKRQASSSTIEGRTARNRWGKTRDGKKFLNNWLSSRIKRIDTIDHFFAG